MTNRHVINIEVITLRQTHLALYTWSIHKLSNRGHNSCVFSAKLLSNSQNMRLRSVYTTCQFDNPQYYAYYSLMVVVYYLIMHYAHYSY